jgi:triphosphatase
MRIPHLVQMGPPAPGAAPLRATPTAEACARRVLVEAHANLLGWIEVLKVSGDARPVHQTRVACRKLRSALRLTGGEHSPQAYHRLRQRYGKLAGRLGTLRDLDVFLATTLTDAESAVPDIHWDLVYRLAHQQRTACWEKARHFFCDKRMESLDRQFDQLLKDPVPSAQGFASARCMSRSLLDHCWAPVSAFTGTLEDQSPGARHRLRIQIKHMRFACHFFDALYEDRQASLWQGRLEELQNTLGHLNDLNSIDTLMQRLMKNSNKNQRPALIKAHGALLGWHARGLEDSLALADQALRHLQVSTPYWHRPA